MGVVIWFVVLAASLFFNNHHCCPRIIGVVGTSTESAVTNNHHKYNSYPRDPAYESPSSTTTRKCDEKNRKKDSDTVNNNNEVPVIDLSQPDHILIPQIAFACSEWGFFQVTNHGISQSLIDRFRHQMKLFFDLPHETKLKLKRDARNARGYFDDELTKRRRDWKECLDVGVPGSRDWTIPDDHSVADGSSNACLDGFNRLPDPKLLPEFRPTIVEYFKECEVLSDRIAILMGLGLGVDEGGESSLVWSLRDNHTSYLRMNFYPRFVSSTQNKIGGKDESTLGISPHRDAGFLTVLLQDDDCHSLQVLNQRQKIEDDVGDEPERWTTISPVRGALTINTGDMAMIWSNGLYKAPLHRVLTNRGKTRYSAPFFYNPGYHDEIAPVLRGQHENGRSKEKIKYAPCVWGYFRAVRFAGDLTDLGVEIQTSDFELDSKSSHPLKQSKYLKVANFGVPFDVDRYRSLLGD